MRLLTCSSGIVVFAALLAIVARADEEKISLDKLPRAVLDTVKAKFPGARLQGAEKEEDKGKIAYEVSLQYKDHAYEVVLSPDGKILAIEKTITAAELPEAVSAALAAKYAKATVKQIEEVSQNNKVSYEVHLVTAQNQRVEVVFDPAGKVLREERGTEKKR